jgi:hypothetical protein
MIASLGEVPQSFPADLVRFSTRIEETRLQHHQARPPTSPFSAQEYYGAALMPLHDRDIDALMGLFAAEDLDAIEQDLLTVLQSLWPEPCWDDAIFEPLDQSLYDFLNGYL